MQAKYILEISEAQAIILRTAVRNELSDCRQSLKELKALLSNATMIGNDRKYIAILKADIQEIKEMIGKLEKTKQQLYDML